MKKALCILAAGIIVVAFSSCNKKCTCKTYEAGKVVATTTVDNPNKNVKCASYTYTETDEDGKWGTECK